LFDIFIIIVNVVISVVFCHHTKAVIRLERLVNMFRKVVAYILEVQLSAEQLKDVWYKLHLMLF